MKNQIHSTTPDARRRRETVARVAEVLITTAATIFVICVLVLSPASNSAQNIETSGIARHGDRSPPKVRP